LDRLDTDDCVVPALWWFEVRNALITSGRRQRLAQAATAEFLRRLSSLPIAVDHTPDENVLLDMARRYRLSVYGAAYLELAVRLGVPLATTDSDLINAAPQSGVKLLAAE
jgi:predicted nucleic acid-binding protein